jgi:hypothetical protein
MTTAGKSIAAGLQAVLAYVQGDTSRGRAQVVQVPVEVDVKAIKMAQNLGISYLWCTVSTMSEQEVPTSCSP